MAEGWLCPKCGQAWAPWVAACTCKNVTTTTSVTLPPCEHEYGTPEGTSAIPSCRKCGQVAPRPPQTSWTIGTIPLSYTGDDLRFPNISASVH